MRNTDIPYAVTFTHQHNTDFVGVINRHNRRKYMKLSRLGRLFSNQVPFFFLHHSGQVKT